MQSVFTNYLYHVWRIIFKLSSELSVNSHHIFHWLWMKIQQTKRFLCWVAILRQCYTLVARVEITSHAYVQKNKEKSSELFFSMVCTSFLCVWLLLPCQYIYVIANIFCNHLVLYTERKTEACLLAICGCDSTTAVIVRISWFHCRR
jgi:hypothetical protein